MHPHGQGNLFTTQKPAISLIENNCRTIRKGRCKNNNYGSPKRNHKSSDRMDEKKVTENPSVPITDGLMNMPYNRK